MLDLSKQSVPVGDGPHEGARARRNTAAPDSLQHACAHGRVKTLVDNFEYAVEQFGTRRFLGTRKVLADGSRGEYEWETYADVHAKVGKCTTALVRTLGVSKGDRVGVYSQNREEWVVSDLAVCSLGAITVALYDSLGPNAAKYIVDHAGIEVVLAQSSNVANVAALIRDGSAVRHVVYFGDAPELEGEWPASVQLHSYDALLAGVTEVAPLPPPPDADDLCVIMYTSGTTGNPKGVMLTHANLVSLVSALQFHDIALIDNDVYLSFLPMAHVFERLLVACFTFIGGAIGFYQGDPRKLVEDLGVLQPTVLAAVPRVYNKIFDSIRAKVSQSGFLKRWLFQWGVADKIAKTKAGLETPWWDAILFNKVKGMLGGKLRAMVSGSAPLDPDVQAFVEACFCAPLYQGYGLTETTGVSTVMNVGDLTNGHNGPPLVHNEVKLVDVPEMKYLTSNDPPCGEVWIRGANIFKGYYKDEKKTREALDADGWFRSGDIGRWNKEGTLSIIDRKKNIFKLSQGEYVAVEYVESVFQQSTLIEQIFVYGDSFKRFLVAVVVPSAQMLEPMFGDRPLEELVKDDAVNKAVLDDMTALGKQHKLKGFEFVKVIHLSAELFSVENGLLTPTFKMKRPQAKEAFQAEIDAMYASRS